MKHKLEIVNNRDCADIGEAVEVNINIGGGGEPSAEEDEASAEEIEAMMKRCNRSMFKRGFS